MGSAAIAQPSPAQILRKRITQYQDVKRHVLGPGIAPTY